MAVPPSNDVDVFAHDLGFIAILDQAGEVVGYNVTVGGGMGMTHGETADLSAHCRRDGLLQAGGCGRCCGSGHDRAARLGRPPDRKHARLKYTIEDRGLDGFRAEVERAVA